MNQTELYSEFKLFKEIYTSVNCADEIIFSVNKNGEIYLDLLCTSPNSNYFILRGRLLRDKTKFTEWLIERKAIVKIPIKSFQLLAKTLKKDAVSVEWDASSFTFKTNNFTLVLENNSLLKEIVEKRENISFFTKMCEKFKIEETYIKNEVFEIFKDEMGIYNFERRGEKIIEIPSKRILSILKDGEHFLCSRLVNGRKMVELSSKNKNLELSEIFATI